jgi:hypothetical protein
VVVLGCSSKSGETASEQDASLSCPVTVDVANGAACPVEKQDCPIGYPCGPFAQQAHCICTNGIYVCTDSAGNAIDKGASPVCVPPGSGNDKDCPASEADAVSDKGGVCKTPGLQCFYIGASCPENAQPNMDVCQCVGVGDGSLHYNCEQKTCNPRSDASGILDVGLPDTQVEDVKTDGG